MNLGNAIGNFLIGNTDPNSDGLAVSQSMNDGQAQVIPKYSGEAWQQATQNRQRQEQIDLQRQKQQQEDNAPKNDLLKTLSKISGYRPQEFANIKLRHDKLVAQTLALNPSAPDYPEKLAEIQSGLMVLNEGVQGSKDLKKSYEGANDLVQKGTHYFDPTKVKELTDDYNQDYGIVDDDMKWLDIMGSKAGKATALSSDIPLIKDKNAYLKNLVNSTSRTVETGKSHKDPYSGEWVRETKIITDPEALQTKIELEKANPQIFSLFGSADEFEKQAKASGYYNEKISAKFQPNQSGKGWTNDGGGLSNGKMMISAPIEVPVIVNNSHTAYDKYVKGLTKGQTPITFDEWNTKHPAQAIPTKVNPIEDIRKDADNSARIFIDKDGNKVQGKLFGHSGTDLILKIADPTGGDNPTYISIPASKNQGQYNDLGSNADEVTKLTKDFSGTATKVVDKGKVVEVKPSGKQKEYVIKGKKYSDSDVAKAAKQSDMTVQEYINALNSIK